MSDSNAFSTPASSHDAAIFMPVPVTSGGEVAFCRNRQEVTTEHRPIADGCLIHAGVICEASAFPSCGQAPDRGPAHCERHGLRDDDIVMYCSGFRCCAPVPGATRSPFSAVCVHEQGELQ